MMIIISASIPHMACQISVTSGMAFWVVQPWRRIGGALRSDIQIRSVLTSERHRSGETWKRNKRHLIESESLGSGPPSNDADRLLRVPLIFRAAVQELSVLFFWQIVDTSGVRPPWPTGR
jgi:hypothetical protein